MSKDAQITPVTTTKLALGVTTLELIGVGVEYATAGKIDGTLLAVAACTAVVAVVSESQRRAASGMAQAKEDMDQTLDRIRELRGSSE